MIAWLIAFAALFFTDIAWGFYLARANSLEAVKAAGWAVVLFLTGASAVIGYTENRWLLIPSAAGAAAGAAAGTWLAITIEKRKKKK